MCVGGGGYDSDAIRNTTLFTVSRFSGQERRRTLHRLNQWQIHIFSKGGAGHLGEVIREGGRSPKKFFSAFGLKIRGGGAPFPGSATVNSRRDFHIKMGGDAFRRLICAIY